MISEREVERQFGDLLATAKRVLPTESFDEARHYMDHSELELALDTIAATLSEAGKRASPELYVKFLTLANAAGIPETFWDSVRPTG
jgi:hypothetical protein